MNQDNLLSPLKWVCRNGPEGNRKSLSKRGDKKIKKAVLFSQVSPLKPEEPALV